MEEIDLSIDAVERSVLKRLEELVRQGEAAATIEAIAARVERRLANDAAAPLAWECVPLETYTAEMPPGIASSWVFVLRARTATGAERHPNSRQRVMSFRGCGDLQVMVDGAWRSNPLASELGEPLERRWLSIPANAWHQAVVPASNWTVVSFHTARPDELIAERPEPGNPAATRQRTYWEARRASRGGANQ